MNVALITIYIIVGVGLLISANRHGQTEKYSFWTSLISKAISLTLIWWALGWEFI